MIDKNKFKYDLLDTHKYGVHSIIYNLVEKEREILDIGCATGYFDKKLLIKNCVIWGIDNNDEALKKARKYCNKVIKFDANKLKNLNLSKRFDYVLILDVIEHLQDPENCVRGGSGLLKSYGKIIISTPNIAHISIRLKLLLGKFEYEKLGILDDTHIKFFTKRSFLNFLKKMNLDVDKLEYSVDFGQIPLIGRFLDKIPQDIQKYFTHLFNTLLAVQFIAICQKNKTK